MEVVKILVSEIDEYEKYLIEAVKEFFEKHPDRKAGFLAELDATGIEQKEYGRDLE